MWTIILIVHINILTTRTVNFCVTPMTFYALTLQRWMNSVLNCNYMQQRGIFIILKYANSISSIPKMPGGDGPWNTKLHSARKKAYLAINCNAYSTISCKAKRRDISKMVGLARKRQRGNYLKPCQYEESAHLVWRVLFLGCMPAFYSTLCLTNIWGSMVNTANLASTARLGM